MFNRAEKSIFMGFLHEAEGRGGGVAYFSSGNSQTSGRCAEGGTEKAGFYPVSQPRLHAPSFLVNGYCTLYLPHSTGREANE